MFSFPMKYASIEHTDRTYVGEEWNKKFSRAINVILNVTSGVVAKEEEFFLRAYGRNPKEFRMILTMPDDFIRFRDYFEQIGLTQKWKKCYLELEENDREELLNIISQMVENPELLEGRYNEKIDTILPFYHITKKKIIHNPTYYLNYMV